MIGKFDYRVYTFCRKLHKKNAILDRFFILGAANAIFILGTLAFLLSYVNGGVSEVWLLLLKMALGLGISALVGVFVRRKRPTKAHLGKPLIKLMRFEYWKSFPSDHALLSTVFLLETLPFISLNGAYILAFLWVWILTARVYVGVHYVSDVAFGAFLGLLVQLIIGTIG